jgi:hypothetical protein
MGEPGSFLDSKGTSFAFQSVRDRSSDAIEIFWFLTNSNPISLRRTYIRLSLPPEERIAMIESLDRRITAQQHFVPLLHEVFTMRACSTAYVRSFLGQVDIAPPS